LAWQPLANAYFESDPGRRSAAKLLTQDEAQRPDQRAHAAADIFEYCPASSRPTYLKIMEA
jgi:hypothetical protein